MLDPRPPSLFASQRASDGQALYNKMQINMGLPPIAPHEVRSGGGRKVQTAEWKGTPRKG